MTQLRLLARRLLLAAPLLALPAGRVPPLAAQAQGAQAGAGAISGSIVDAGSGLPLADVSVSLEPREAGALPSPTRTGAVAGSWATRTDTAGRYRFARVAEGEYRLRVQRIGYHPATVEVSLRGPAASRVSVGLTVRPVALEPLEARAAAGGPVNPFGRRADPAGADAEDARLEAERQRQRRFLAPDVRAVTGRDVEEGVTLAEADLFRALQRLPGVGARDDYSAEMWTRGAPWDHTRVYFDGIPLYHPVHSSGLLSGVNADAVGAVFFHPGAQPVSLAGGAAATLDVRSRRGGEDGGVAGIVEASLASVRVAADGTAGSRVAWMAAARHSYTGWLLDRLEGRVRERDPWTTSHFGDAVLRLDLRLGPRTTLETSALGQRDLATHGPDADWPEAGSPRWGSLAVRTTLQTPVSGLRTRITAGTSLFGARVHEAGDALSQRRFLLSWPTLFATRSAVRYGVLEGSVEPEAAAAGAVPWSAGGGVVRHEVEYDGPPAFPLDMALPPSTLRRDDALAYAFAWADGRWRPGERLAVDGGLRVEAGSSVPGGGALRWSPRVAARLQAGPRVTLAAAVGRSHQYVQAGPELGEQMLTQHLWLLAGGDVPVLRSDVATLGAEAWLGGSWLGSVTAYERRSTGVATMDPTPGEAMGRPVFVPGTLEAEGVEVAVRRLAGRVTMSGSYSWGVSTVTAAGLSYPAPSGQRHSLDLAARARVGGGLHLGAALTAASGGHFTRFYGGIARCAQEVACEWAELPRTGRPGAVRADGYASVDLLLDWMHGFGGWAAGAFVRVNNVLDRTNPARYNRSILYARCGVGRPVDDAPGCTEDLWSNGMPRLPIAGVRVTF